MTKTGDEVKGGGFTPGEWHVRNNGPHWNNPSITNYDVAWSPDGELVAEHVYELADAHLMAGSKRLYAAAMAVCEKLYHPTAAVTARDADNLRTALAACVVPK